MSKKRLEQIDEQTRESIIADVSAGLKLYEISEKYGIDNKTLKELREEAGLPTRSYKSRTRTKKAVEIKKCPNCHRKIAIEGAKFCPFCATDIRSKKDILLEDATKLWRMTEFLPLNECNFADRVIGAMIGYIREH